MPWSPNPKVLTYTGTLTSPESLVSDEVLAYEFDACGVEVMYSGTGCSGTITLSGTTNQSSSYFSALEGLQNVVFSGTSGAQHFIIDLNSLKKLKSVVTLTDGSADIYTTFTINKLKS